jgi:hypothetical protein
VSGGLETDASWVSEFRREDSERCHFIFFIQSVLQWRKIRIANRKCLFTWREKWRETRLSKSWTRKLNQLYFSWIISTTRSLDKEPSPKRTITRVTTLGTKTSAGTSFHQVTDTASFKDTFYASIRTLYVFYSSTATTLTAATLKSSCFLLSAP